MIEESVVETLQHLQESSDVATLAAATLKVFMEHQNGFALRPDELIEGIAGPLSRLCANDLRTVEQVKVVKALHAVAAKPIPFDA